MGTGGCYAGDEGGGEEVWVWGWGEILRMGCVVGAEDDGGDDGEESSMR